MAKRFLKRLGLMVLSMAVFSIVGFLTWAYLAPVVIDIDVFELVNDGGEAFHNGINGVDGVMGGALSDTTDKIEGRPIAKPTVKPTTVPTYPGERNGTVNRIIDGDTLVIGSTTVRLALVNTPERGEAGYSEATQFTREQCQFGSKASYTIDSGQKGGSYGRTIAKVWCMDTSQSLNELLLTNGHADILTSFCSKSEFGSDEWAKPCRGFPTL